MAAVARGRSGTVPALVIFFSVLLLYLLNLVADYSHDSISYAVSMEKDRLWGVFHSHHLLYNYFKWFTWKALSAFGIHTSALYVGQALNAVCGAAAASLFFLVLKRTAGSAYIRFAGVLALISVYGFWYCSTFNGVRIAHIALMIPFLMLLVGFTRSRNVSFTFISAYAVLIALVHSIIILLHQVHFLAAVIVALAFLMKAGKPGRKLAAFAFYLLVLISVTGGLYLYIGTNYYDVKSFATFMSWFRNYADYGWWGKFTNNSLSQTLFGLKVHFFGPYYVKGYVFYPVVIICLALLVNLIFRFKKLFALNREYVALSLAWLAVYVPFFVWWEPYNQEFWVFTLIPFVLLLSLSADALIAAVEKPAVRLGLSIFFLVAACLFFIYGFTGPIRAKKDKWQNINFRNVSSARAITKDREDMFIVNGEDGGLDHNLEYFLPNKLLVFESCLEKSKGDEAAAIMAMDGAIKDNLSAAKRVFVEKNFTSADRSEYLASKYASYKAGPVEAYFSGKYDIIPLKDITGTVYFNELKYKKKK